jgi:hypothetical protein
LKTLDVLHGTRTVFKTFSKDIEARFSTGQNLLGHFFTDQPEQSLVYSEPTVDKVCDKVGLDDDLERNDAEFIDFCEEDPGVILKVKAKFNSMNASPYLVAACPRLTRCHSTSAMTIFWVTGRPRRDLMLSVLKRRTGIANTRF